MEKESEVVGHCKICHKVLTRDQHEHYRFYKGTFACASHKGVIEWFNNAIACENQKLIDDGVVQSQ